MFAYLHYVHICSWDPALWHLPALSGALGDLLDSARPCQFLGPHSRHCSHTAFLAVLEHREPVPAECVFPPPGPVPSGVPVTLSLPALKSSRKCPLLCELFHAHSVVTLPALPRPPPPYSCQWSLSPSDTLDILLFVPCLFPLEYQQHEGRDFVMSTALSSHQE